MTFKKFQPGDIINNIMIAKPEMNFIIHSASVFLQKERSDTGDFSNTIKHINSGHVSLHELNINRPADSLISSFLEKSSTRYAFNTISTSDFDDENQFLYGDKITQAYPLSASISRIYIPAGAQYSSSAQDDHENKKYIRALRNPINSTGRIGPSNIYGDLGTKAVNLVCIPGIFYGSSIDLGSIELNYYVTGTLVSTAKDLYSDGRLVQTYPVTGSEVGVAIYNQGILVLTGSDSLHETYQDNFLSAGSTTSPTWLSFGTGMQQVGTRITTGVAISSSYSLSFRGVSKIPTMTMFAYSEKGEDNFSHNPTFLKSPTMNKYSFTNSSYIESKADIKKINRSEYSDYESDFLSTVYISKVGIYDKDKNLIAIATLANPIKKTEKRDFMIKMKMDF